MRIRILVSGFLGFLVGVCVGFLFLFALLNVDTIGLIELVLVIFGW